PRKKRRGRRRSMGKHSKKSENLGVDRKNLEVDPENLELDPENLEVDPKNVEVGRKNLEVDPENLEVDPENLEVIGENLDDFCALVDQIGGNLCKLFVKSPISFHNWAKNK